MKNNDLSFLQVKYKSIRRRLNNPARLHNFSAEDIYKLAYYWSIGKINNLSTFSYTVVTDSTSYILMIDNPAAFITFAQTWFDSEKHIKGFEVWLYTTHG